MHRVTAAVVIALLGPGAASTAAQQQGSIQISTESQVLSGDPSRTAGQNTVEPDFGVLWQQPSATFGQFLLETRATRSDQGLRLGRTWAALRDTKAGGLTWAFEGGDLYTSTAGSDYQFSNLSTPAFTFSGAQVTARGPRSMYQVVAGRSTALRNLFGTDPDTLGQSVVIGRAMFQPDSRVQINARAARTRTWDLNEFTHSTDASLQAGGGTRITVTPWLQVVGDGSYVRYRATGAIRDTLDYSYVTGAHLLLSRGWVQVNATRFSPGDLPVLNAPLQDRSGLFGAAEYDVFSRLRLFGGWERVDTNINPSGALLLRPAGRVDRGYGGLRMRVGDRSSFSVRYEDGGRLSRPVSPAPVARAAATSSDTGLFTTEWQTNLRGLTAFGRYSRRENVDVSNGSGTFTQHDGSAQLFVNLTRKSQLFGLATLTHQALLAGGGNTFLEISGGGQRQIAGQGLWLRLEGTATRNKDLLTGALAPRDALGIGLNGQLTDQTMVGINVYVDRAPSAAVPFEGGWLTRSTVRVIHNIPTGSVRVPANGSASIGGRPARGSGSVLGSIFADWNANGVPDPGEELLAGIPVALGTISHVTTARDGQFAFLNVPAGAQRVGVDLRALPVDFDPPAVADVVIELGRGDTKRVAFGLVPLGAVHGRVVEDANRNGQIDPADPAIDGAVLTLDGGQRSELARKGSFRFDAVRAGEHRLLLLKESLPEGAAIVSAAEQPVVISRDHPQVEIVYLVRIEKRPEVRKVFPPKIGAAQPAAPARSVPSGRPAAPTAIAHASATAPRTPAAQPRPGTAVESANTAFTIQIAALNDPVRAEHLMEDLKSAGFAAYLVEPGQTDPDGPYRIRVGRYRSRAEAQKTLTSLEDHLGEKLWVTRAR